MDFNVVECSAFFDMCISNLGFRISGLGFRAHCVFVSRFSGRHVYTRVGRHLKLPLGAHRLYTFDVLLLPVGFDVIVNVLVF